MRANKEIRSYQSEEGRERLEIRSAETGGFQTTRVDQDATRINTNVGGKGV